MLPRPQTATSPPRLDSPPIQNWINEPESGSIEIPPKLIDFGVFKSYFFEDCCPPALAAQPDYRKYPTYRFGMSGKKGNPVWTGGRTQSDCPDPCGRDREARAPRGRGGNAPKAPLPERAEASALDTGPETLAGPAPPPFSQRIESTSDLLRRKYKNTTGQQKLH